MVQIPRSYDWEEFRQDFLYYYIELLDVLDDNSDISATARLLWMLVAYAFSFVLFVAACSLMLLFYRRVDPRHPNLRPQPLTFRELFLDLRPSGDRGLYEKLPRLPDDSSGPKSAESTGQHSGSGKDGQPTEKSVAVPIVATSTPLVTPARTSAETVVAVTRTPLVTPGRTSAEPLISKTGQTETPAKKSVEHSQEKPPSQEKVDRPRPSLKTTRLALARTQGSSEKVLKDSIRSREKLSKERPESLRLLTTASRSKELSKERSREPSKERINEEVNTQQSAVKAMLPSILGGSKKKIKSPDKR